MPYRKGFKVEPGERIRLRNVDIRIEGPASELPAFRVPSASRLKAGSALNHGRYEDAKRLIQNQASRYGFFDGRFSRQRLEIDPPAGVASGRGRHHTLALQFPG